MVMSPARRRMTDGHLPFDRTAPAIAPGPRVRYPDARPDGIAAS